MEIYRRPLAGFFTFFWNEGHRGHSRFSAAGVKKWGTFRLSLPFSKLSPLHCDSNSFPIPTQANIGLEWATRLFASRSLSSANTLCGALIRSFGCKRTLHRCCASEHSIFIRGMDERIVVFPQLLFVNKYPK